MRPMIPALLMKALRVAGVWESWKFQTASWAKMPRATSRARRTWKLSAVRVGTAGAFRGG